MGRGLMPKQVEPIWKQPREKKPRKRVNPIGKRSRLRSDEWTENRAAVMERCGGQCEYFIDGTSAFAHCTARATQVHHRLPTSQGGGHDLDNLVALCSPHHLHIHAWPEKSYAAGWLVRRTTA